jgi:peptidyl-prolyl cis-trans isomerase C
MTIARATLSRLALAAALAYPLAVPALAQMPAPGNEAAAAPEEKPLPPDTLLATVNGQKITQLDVNMAAEDIGANLPQQLKGKARTTYLLDYLIDGTLVAQKAKADQLDKTPDFSQKMAYAEDKVLMEAILTKIAATSTSDAQMHKIYDDAKAQQKPQEELHARHILVASEADAQAVEKRLKAGEDFAKVAKEVSKDPSAEGGELPWFTREQMVPAFSDAAFKLQKGQISDPVKTQFGWHVIKLEDRRQKPFPAFDQVKDQIQRFAIQKAQSELILSLRKGAKIERTAAAPAEVPAQPMPGSGGDK